MTIAMLVEAIDQKFAATNVNLTLQLMDGHKDWLITAIAAAAAAAKAYLF
jgi:hypothetical protein